MANDQRGDLTVRARHRTVRGISGLALGLAAALLGGVGAAGAAGSPPPVAGVVPLGATGLPTLPTVAGGSLAGSAAAGSSVPTLSSVVLAGDSTPVTLADGQTWDLSVGWFSVSSSLELVLGHTVTTGGEGAEIHGWTVPVPSSVFSLDSTTGGATLDTGTHTSPLATVDVTFTATKTTDDPCVSGTETTYSGTLTGTVQLDTGLAGAGTVGGTGLSLGTTTPSVTVDDGCIVAAPPCQTEALWDSGAKTTVPTAVGVDVNGTGYTEVYQGTSLGSLVGAERVDEALVDSSAPVWDATTTTLSVSSSSAGIVTGTATLSGGKAKALKASCSLNGKKHKETTVTDLNATYASATGAPLTAHMTLTGPLTVPSPAKPAGFSVLTYAA